VIAGTATAVSGRVAHRQQQRYAEDARQSAGAYYPPDEPQPVDAATDYVQELERLAVLKDQGVITMDEFQAKKKQLLGL
jgi:hypothetical protein